MPMLNPRGASRRKLDAAKSRTTYPLSTNDAGSGTSSRSSPQKSAPGPLCCRTMKTATDTQNSSGYAVTPHLTRPKTNSRTGTTGASRSQTYILLVAGRKSIVGASTSFTVRRTRLTRILAADHEETPPTIEVTGSGDAYEVWHHRHTEGSGQETEPCSSWTCARV